MLVLVSLCALIFFRFSASFGLFDFEGVLFPFDIFFGFSEIRFSETTSENKDKILKINKKKLNKKGV
jgi:hypothetical protein